MLLSQTTGIGKDNVRYVYGMKNGVYRSWNIVKIGEKWYNLDVAANDFGLSTDVNYRYFLTNNLGEHRITVGSDTLIKLDDSTFNHLATVDNKAVSDRYIYYVNRDGKISKLNKTTLLPVTDAEDNKLPKVAATTAPGKMVYIKHDNNSESLYFANTSMGSYLYELKIPKDAATDYTLQLLIQKPIESISATEKTVTYKSVGEEVTTFATSLKDNHNNAIKAVETSLTELRTLADQLNDSIKSAYHKVSSFVAFLFLFS